MLIWFHLNHECTSICQGKIILWVLHLQVICMKVAINNNETLKEPSRRFARLEFVLWSLCEMELLVRKILPVIWKIDPWLQTCRTKMGQGTILWLSLVMAKAIPFPWFKILPLSRDPSQFPLSVLGVGRKMHHMLWKRMVLTGTVGGNALFVKQHNFFTKLAAAVLHSIASMWKWSNTSNVKAILGQIWLNEKSHIWNSWTSLSGASWPWHQWTLYWNTPVVWTIFNTQYSRILSHFPPRAD